MRALNKKFQNNKDLLNYLDLYVRKMQHDLEEDLANGMPEHVIDFQNKKIQGIVQLRVSLEKDENEIEEEEE